MSKRHRYPAPYFDQVNEAQLETGGLIQIMLRHIASYKRMSDNGQLPALP